MTAAEIASGRKSCATRLKKYLRVKSHPYPFKRSRAKGRGGEVKLPLREAAFLLFLVLGCLGNATIFWQQPEAQRAGSFPRAKENNDLQP